MASEISFFFFNDTATTEIYTLSLHDALPISRWLLERDGSRRLWARIELGDPWLSAARARASAGAADSCPATLQQRLVADPCPQKLPLTLRRSEALQATRRLRA